MTGISHHLAAVELAFVLHLPPLGLGAAFFGAILPDLCDQWLSSLLSCTRRGRARRFAALHRGTSHWFGLWLGLLLLGDGLDVFCNELLTGLGIGALSHLLLDALTPRGIPLLPFVGRIRLALPLCRTGSLGEYGLLLVFSLLFAWFFGADLWKKLAAILFTAF